MGQKTISKDSSNDLKLRMFALRLFLWRDKSKIQMNSEWFGKHLLFREDVKFLFPIKCNA